MTAPPLCEDAPFGVFNTGSLGGTLLRKLNAGDYRGAAEAFGLHIYARGPKTNREVRLNGLVTRRKREATLFLSDGLPPAAGCTV